MRRLLPRWFRDAWGPEISALVAREQAAAGRAGRLALLRFHVRTAADLARAGWQTRAGARRWRHDLRLALRSLRRSPAFVLAGILTLGLGTSVSAGMFSALEQTLIRPLPLEKPDALLHVQALLPPETQSYGLTPIDFTTLEARATTLAGSAYYLPARLDADIVLQTDDGPERINGLRVAPDYFTVLGVRPWTGPGFDQAENAGPEIMLSHVAWSTTYGADESIVGRTLAVDGRPHTVVGILPADFNLAHGGRRPDYWIARRLLQAELDAWDALVLEVVARVAPGRDSGEAHAEIVSLGQQFAAERPGTLPERRLTTVPLPDAVRDGWTAPLAMLGGAAFLVLLMACGSVALLVLARQAGRRRELALWMALGASHGSVARRLGFELLPLGIGGLALGVALAMWGTNALLGMAPTSIPGFDGFRFDWPLWIFAAVACLAAIGLAGAAPLARLRRLDAAACLRSGTRSGSASESSRTRALIVGAECGMMAVLLVALGLALVSFARLSGVDAGFEPESRVAIEVTAPQLTGLNRQELFTREIRFFTELRERLLAVPGVTAAGTISNLPLTEGWGGALYVEHGRIEGAPEAPAIDWEVAGPGYFETAGIRVVRGRGFEPGDVAGAPYVVVINETLAQRYFPDRDPIGLSISGESPDGPWRRVIGVVADVRQHGLDAAPRPHMYIAHGQAFAFGTYQVVVATEPGAQLDTATMRGIIRTVDTSAVAGTVRPLGELVDASLAASRLAMTLIAVFAGLATLLAVAGAWGVISLVGRSRQQEWAVRSALGASRRQIVAAAARAGGIPVIAGLAIGFGIALVGGRWLSGELYGLSAWEPRVLAGVLATLLAVTAVVVILPARRASRVDPASVFRE